MHRGRAPRVLSPAALRAAVRVRGASGVLQAHQNPHPALPLERLQDRLKACREAPHEPAAHVGAQSGRFTNRPYGSDSTPYPGRSGSRTARSV